MPLLKRNSLAVTSPLSPKSAIKYTLIKDITSIKFKQIKYKSINHYNSIYKAKAFFLNMYVIVGTTTYIFKKKRNFCDPGKAES